MRLGLFGGAFDPIHYGHLLLAECCREQHALDAVWLIPAAEPPHKRRPDLTPVERRLDMVELAIAGHAAFAVCRLEAERPGPSYTVDTLEALRIARPEDEFCLLLGADALAELPRWRGCERVIALASVIVANRGGESAATIASVRQSLPAANLLEADMPRIALCSRDLRERAARGASLRYRTPRAVEKYIETHGCYRSPAGS